MRKLVAGAIAASIMLCATAVAADGSPVGGGAGGGTQMPKTGLGGASD